jgi:hypothetical protein
MTVTAEVQAAFDDAVQVARLPYLDMAVIFDDGRRYASHGDQRDMRRAQIAIGVDPELDPLGFNRATAWAHLTRVGALDGVSWADFDRDVAFVIPLEEQTTADPTQAAPPA